MRHNDGNNDGEVGTANSISKKIGEYVSLLHRNTITINFDKHRGEYCALKRSSLQS